MQALIWIGAAISAAGLAGILWCIVTVAGYRRKGLSDEAMRVAMRRAVMVNMAALFTSVIGLMSVVVGIMLR